MINKTQKIFFALLQGGLWEQEVELRKYGTIDFSEILRLATEQSVIGLVTAGLEQVKDVKVPQMWVLKFVGLTLQIEKRNKEMNAFIAEIVEALRKAGIYGLLVKGSGLAQCYEKPLWRMCGDVDLFFSCEDYPKAVEFFSKMNQTRVVQNAQYTKSFGVIIAPWFVELHGTMRNGMSTKMDREIDAVQRNLFYDGNIRTWMNGPTQVFLPGATNDVFIVFVHFVRHFYKEGVNIRQICDWCRIIFSYREKLNLCDLELRIRNAGLMSEWQAFATVAVKYLGMPVDSMPLFYVGGKNDEKRWNMKAERIMSIIMDCRSDGKLRNTWRISKVFPWHTIRFLPSIFFHLNWLKVKERLFLR